MNETSCLFDLEHKIAGQDFLDIFDSVLNDSDADGEKDKIKEFIKNASSQLEICLLGKKRTDEESLLSLLFPEVCSRKKLQELMFIEYRYGEEKVEFQVNSQLLRVFEKVSSLKGISVVEMPDLSEMAQTEQVLCDKYLKSCDVLVVAFDSDDIGDFEIWNKLETIEEKKMVFVIMATKDNKLEQLQCDKNRLARYLKEENIYGPIYSSEELDEIRSYVNKYIIGNNPKIQKQLNNIMQLKGLLCELNQSFLLRKRQYEQDVYIVSQINKSLDTFIQDNQEKVDGLKKVLKNDIYIAIQQYEDEIVNRLNPKQIKERFPRGSADFVDYLNFISESYRVRMTDNVNRKTQEMIRAYLKELEIVFDEATGFLRNRESLIKLEDKFYGSMAMSKQKIIGKMKNDLQLTNDYYRSLSEASGELFYKIWQERDKYDRKVNNATLLGAIGGAIAGTGATVGGVGTIGALGGVSSGATGAIAAMGILWPAVVAVVGAVFISQMAKRISSSKNMNEMEKNIQLAINDFRIEVSNTREQMVTQIMDTLDAMIQQEIEAVDRTFADFRMTVNIDGRNIPLLDEKVKKLNMIMSYFDEENLLEC